MRWRWRVIHSWGNLTCGDFHSIMITGGTLVGWEVQWHSPGRLFWDPTDGEANGVGFRVRGGGSACSVFRVACFV